MSKFQIGDQIHGFAGGAFGRDSYDCRIVEAVGTDWAVTRNTNGEPEMVSGTHLQHAYYARTDRSFCYEGCEATP